MLGFHAEYKSGDIVCQPGEIADAQWFTRDTLPQTPPKTAISGWLIEEFIPTASVLGVGRTESCHGMEDPN